MEEEQGFPVQDAGQLISANLQILKEIAVMTVKNFFCKEQELTYIENIKQSLYNT